jgi:hypothetical protein
MPSNAIEWYVDKDNIYVVNPFKPEVRAYKGKNFIKSYSFEKIKISPPKMRGNSRKSSYYFPSGIDGIAVINKTIYLTTFKVLPQPSEFYFYTFDMDTRKLKKFKLKNYFRIEKSDLSGNLYLLGEMNLLRVKIK